MPRPTVKCSVLFAASLDGFDARLRLRVRAKHLPRREDAHPDAALNETLRRVLACALSIAAGLAHAGDAPLAAALRARAVAVHCRPALPFFCANIHVGCSGRTELKTFAFELQAQSDRARIESAAASAGIWAPYENARAQWDPEAAYVILRPRGTRGYIKLLAGGRYSFRHYAQDTGLMSHGHCH